MVDLQFMSTSWGSLTIHSPLLSKFLPIIPPFAFSSGVPIRIMDHDLFETQDQSVSNDTRLPNDDSRDSDDIQFPI